MASLAAERRAIGAALRHAIVEFAMMDILVAPGTGHIFENKRQNFVSTPRRAYLMAIGARHGGVRLGQCETGVAMFGDRKGGAVKIQNGMTILAFVLIRSGSKLAVMRVFVTVGASRELHLIYRVLAGG